MNGRRINAGMQSIGANRRVINCNGLSKGMYLIKVNYKGKASETRKVVII